MTTMNPAERLEEEIQDLWRLRQKHSPKSPEAASYRQALIDHVRQLRAFRMAQKANKDNLLPPVRKKSFHHSHRLDEPSSS